MDRDREGLADARRADVHEMGHQVAPLHLEDAAGEGQEIDLRHPGRAAEPLLRKLDLVQLQWVLVLEHLLRLPGQLGHQLRVLVLGERIARRIARIGPSSARR
jgi:hypothetical protein